MYPELFRIGTFPITTYGIFLAVGMLLALYVASRLAARDGIPRERFYDLGLWTLIGGLMRLAQAPAPRAQRRDPTLQPGE